jgi:CDP-paratose 2-epimerase
MNILITGGAGFVGASVALYLKQQYPTAQIYSLDNLRRRGSELNLPRLKAAGIHFVHGDIRNPEDFAPLPAIDIFIEASAEPSVLAGLDGTPDYLINTNLVGTVNCLNFAKKTGAKFIFLSTSRVYPIKAITSLHITETDTRFELQDNQAIAGASAKGITENFPLTGARSLYGTTKLASELIIQEYQEFYGLQAVINRFGVITGPWQMGKADQGVMVLWVAKHYYEQQLAYIGFGGSGKQTRDMLHIHDLCRLVHWQIENFEKINGQILNAGGGRQVSASLLELTAICQKVTGKTIPINPIAESRTADIPIYITDNSHITALTGWQPQKSIENIVTDIHHWLQQHGEQLADILK